MRTAWTLLVDGIAAMSAWWKQTWFHLCRYLIAGLSLYAAYLYALSKEDDGHISPDLVSLAWLAFALGVLVFPDLDEIPTPWGSVKLKKSAAKAEESAQGFEELLRDLSEMMQNWSGALFTFLEQTRTGEILEDDQLEAFKRFCEDRMHEAADFLGGENERIRLSLWWYSDLDDGLVMLVSIGAFSQEASTHVFRAGEGLLGQAYRERRIWNTAEPKREPRYLELPGDEDYHGLLMIPLPRNSSAEYVLAIDRERALMFDGVQQNMAEALGHILISAATFSTRSREEASGSP